MAIDLGNIPTGTPPTAGEKLQIRSAIGVGTTDAPTFLAQTLTGQSLTGTQATSLVDLATTWLSTTGTPTAIKLNVTDTASNAASNLMDLQVGGVSKFSVNKAGAAFASSGLFGGIASTTGVDIIYGRTGVSIGSLGAFGFTSGTLGDARDALIFRDAPGILAQRNGTAAQTLRTYNNYTSATVFERGTFGFPIGTNTLRIGTEFLGLGMAALPIDFVTGGVARMSIGATGNTTFAGSVSITTVSAFSSPSGFIVTTLNANGFQTQGGGYMIHTAAHKLRLSGNGDTTGGSLLLDTVDLIQVRNLANTAPGFIQGKLRTETAYTATVVVPTGFLTLYDSTGTAYRVPCVV